LFNEANGFIVRAAMETINTSEEDWNLLVSFFPSNWRDLARQTGALKGLRQDKSEENLIRVLLLHLGSGYSLRETAVRAQRGQLAELSDVALLKRLRKSKEWFHQLCCALFSERKIETSNSIKTPLRLIDATVVKEPGKTGSLWRVHYSFQWPTLRCDYFKITATEGKGSAEALQHYPLKAKEHIIVDRGYCRAKGIHFVESKKAYLTVRLHPHGIVLQDENDINFELLEHLETLKGAGQIGAWKVRIPLAGHRPVEARLCAIRKSQAATALTLKKLKTEASRDGRKLQPETLFYTRYVMVLTTLPESNFSADQILEFYRFRWQIELVFKRFKQIAQLGHLPKYDDESAQAWIYGKLFLALLSEKLIRHASALSPWGYFLELCTFSLPVA
jgi:hypothetical protein